jgi:WD40 repeat protein
VDREADNCREATPGSPRGRFPGLRCPGSTCRGGTLRRLLIAMSDSTPAFQQEIYAPATSMPLPPAATTLEHESILDHESGLDIAKKYSRQRGGVLAPLASALVIVALGISLKLGVGIGVDIGANGTHAGKPIPISNLVTDSSVLSVAFSPDDHTLTTGNEDGTVWLWNLTNPANPVQIGRPLTDSTSGVWSVAFSPDGHTLAAGSDGTVRLWNVTNPAHPVQIGQPLTSSASGVDSVAFSPDGHTLAAGSYDGTVRLWNLNSS